ncbi:MAG: AAA family ATPase [Cyclobacteriaceae bacterium]|nr:AAA family ATPase [Cyclobacteriaceae bacterium]
MIKNLSIQNFKSIKSLDLACKKINVFIGEPNAGKSNVIECISMWSANQTIKLTSLMRLKNLTDLFFDNQTDLKIQLGLNDLTLSVSFDGNSGSFIFSFEKSGQSFAKNYATMSGDNHGHSFTPNEFNIKSYRYSSNNPNNPMPGPLSIPSGDNLVSVLISNSKFKSLISDLFRSKGFRLNIQPIERELLLSKEVGDDIYSYSYSNISETLKRVVFLMACIETNENATILFDEPESNTFPFYTKYFAERLTYDQTNQFFLTTHNPYLLESIVAKTPPENLNVVITYMKDYETKIRVLSGSEVLELMELDVFFNLKRYTESA